MSRSTAGTGAPILARIAAASPAASIYKHYQGTSMATPHVAVSWR